MTEIAALEPVCYLRALEPGDEATTVLWRRQNETWEGLIGPKRAVSSATEREWVERSIDAHARGETFHFGICDAASDDLLGLLRFGKVDLVHRGCDTGWIIGDPGARGKAFAFHARLIGMDYMFTQWGLHRIETSVLSTNERSLQNTRRFGFVHEGTRREAAFQGGRLVDVHMFGITEAEFRAAHPGALGAHRWIR
jgi:RimJ/RimL family protein N-acetyltransferase